MNPLPTTSRTGRRVRRVAAYALGVIALGYAAAVGYMAVRETQLVFVSAGGHYPSEWPVLPPANAGFPWDTVHVRADDGVPVLLLESRVDSLTTRPWIIYIHGNEGLLGSSGNVGRTALFRDAGFNVLAVEYRGYGASRSAGTPTEAGVYADVRAAWTYATGSLHVPPARLAVYGWSLGSGSATYLAETQQPAALFTEGGFTSLPDVGARVYPWLPVRLIMRARFPNLERAAKIHSRWTVFHGTLDTDVPFSNAEALVAAAHGARLVPLTADHRHGVLADRAIALAVLRDVAKSLMR